MKDFTSFTFQHNFDVPLAAEIYIYSVAGRKIKTIRRENIIEKNVSIEWDGKDADGDYIANGTYIYKISVKSEDGSISNIQTGKLAKLK
jgi:flagellar hook assembly protein FlgD